MDYEKAYNEALERAKSIYRDAKSEHCTHTDWLENIFPELKESEDERIRKAFIKAFQEFYPTDKWNKEFTFGQIVAWLERLGDKAFSVERLFAEAGVKPAYKIDHMWCVLIGENMQEGICGLGNTKEEAYVEFLKELWRKAFEPNPSDKDEPKFHIEKGQWYVCIQPFTLNGNIVVEKGRTYKSREDNAISGEDTRLFIDKHDGDASKYFKPWTIQDAKDGDVLVASDGSILLFKCVVDAACRHYIALTTDNTVKYNEGLEHYWETSRAVRPATKEQRDLLFQKMREAGYEWDAEKKELVKIEQKPVIEMKSAEESLGIDSKAYNKIVDECIYGEQNPAWSEEDEKMLNDVIGAIENLISRNESWGYLEDSLEWLKSLKERYTWKPSDEQIKALENSTGADEEQSKALYSLLNDLKKLKG